ncbi:hypothetical protein CDIK_2170 [Cucumispora dikerogammari]|nr:hypothetical protein CDIK_2170 [Cucumispora dikerogammari]
MATIVAAPRNSETTIQKKRKYAGLFIELEITHNNENFVFLAEVGFTVYTRRKKGRSARGTKAYVDVPAVRTRNIFILAAMNKQKMIYNKVHGFDLNGDAFTACLIELKEACTVKGIHNFIFIMDKVRIHHYSGLFDH